MKKSEEGYTLLFVLVTLTVLSVLAIATIGVSLQSTRLTEIRGANIKVDTATQNELDQAIAALQKIVATTSNATPTSSSKQLFADIPNQIVLPLTTSAPNVTVEVNEDDSNARVKALDLTAHVEETKGDQPTVKKAYTQRVYLSAIPSFLYYTLGSDNQVVLNGAPRIEGNVFSREALKVSATPNFVYNGQTGRYTDKLAHPYIDGQVRVFQPQNEPLLACDDFLPCDQTVFDPAVKTALVSTKDTLVPFDFEFALNDFLDIPSNISLATLSDYLKDQMSPPIERSVLTGPFLNELSTKKQIIVPSPAEQSTVTITDDIVKESPEPLIIDGNLTISSLNPITQPLEIKRPIVVLGNLLIRGNVSFATTMFSTGSSRLDDANIQGITSSTNQNTLILLSKGTLTINRVNKFSTPKTDAPDMNAFLYSDATSLNRIYSVGSTMNLQGGIFTKGQLEVNAYRGQLDLPENQFPQDVTALEELMALKKSAEAEKSRLRLKYDASVLKNPTAMLPLSRAVKMYVETPKRTMP
ncbi:type II secretion system protein [Exiguobacterium sp. s193]|uniref:type II secretion system protein n=1 Tax=Exiguobacterium sp. s193 TaxID=2751207 RepID=UPI001BE9F317|nr:type II secretion system protein [Exiguobacterium sp. s193]